MTTSEVVIAARLRWPRSAATACTSRRDLLQGGTEAKLLAEA